MMVDEQVLCARDMTDISNGDSYISRRLDGLCSVDEADELQSPDSSINVVSPQAPAAATAQLAGLTGLSISDRLGNGWAGKFAQTDAATPPSHRTRQDAPKPKTHPTPVMWSAPAAARDSRQERTAHGDPDFRADIGTAVPGSVRQLTLPEWSQARTKLDAGLWTFDDAVRELGVEHADDREKLSVMASQAARFADETLAPSKDDDSPPAPAPTALPTPEQVLHSDAASTALSPRAQAQVLLGSSLAAFEEAETPLEWILSNQYQNEGLFERLAAARQHIDRAAQQANQAFGLLIEETKAAPSSEFSTAVRTRQRSFHNFKEQFEREVGKAGTDAWAFDRLSDAVMGMRRDVRTLRRVLGGDGQ